MSKDYWYRLLFKVKLYEVAGDGFQNLVNSVLGATFPRFQSIAPWGSQGDRGNDGWVQGEGRYFQVYGPKASSNWKPVSAAKKAETDFAKLKTSWPDMRHYTFVLNDRFDGIPAPVVQCLNNLKSAGQVTEADAIGAAEHTDMFMALPEDRRMEITGDVPNDTLTDLEPGITLPTWMPSSRAGIHGSPKQSRRPCAGSIPIASGPFRTHTTRPQLRATSCCLRR